MSWSENETLGFFRVNTARRHFDIRPAPVKIPWPNFLLWYWTLVVRSRPCAIKVFRPSKTTSPEVNRISINHSGK